MDRFKNIVTNILGLIFWGFAIKELFIKESDWMYITFLLVVGIILFRYRFEETKKIVNSLLGKKSEDLKNVGMTVDPDKPDKPDTRG